MYTKGDWKVGSTVSVKNAVYVDGVLVADCKTFARPEQQQKANAHRICTCVNGWDDLEAEKKALREALKHLHDEIKGQIRVGVLKDEDFQTRVYFQQLVNVASEALLAGKATS